VLTSLSDDGYRQGLHRTDLLVLQTIFYSTAAPMLPLHAFGAMYRATCSSCMQNKPSMKLFEASWEGLFCMHEQQYAAWE